MDATAIARRAISLLDLTELGDHATPEQVIHLCSRAVTAHGAVAAVCVWPRHVPLAVEQLWGTNVRVATVVNFPSGAEPVADVVAATSQAIADGADEVHKSFVATKQAKGYKPVEGWPSMHIPTRKEEARARFAQYLDHEVANH